MDRMHCKILHNTSSSSITNFHKEQESSLPENGWSGWCKFTPVRSLERIIAHIFADVSSHKCERQHGGQRGIMQYATNLEQMKHLKVNCSAFHVTWWALHMLNTGSCFWNLASKARKSFHMALISFWISDLPFVLAHWPINSAVFIQYLFQSRLSKKQETQSLRESTE